MAAAAAAVGLAGALLRGAGPELPERAVAYSVAVLRAASDAACFLRQLAAEKVFSLSVRTSAAMIRKSAGRPGRIL